MAKKDAAAPAAESESGPDGEVQEVVYDPKVIAAAEAIEASVVEYVGELAWRRVLSEPDAKSKVEANRGLLCRAIAEGDEFSLEAVRITLHAVIRQNQAGGGTEWYSALSRIVATAVKVARVFV